MATKIGMDADAVRGLASKLEAQAAHIGSIIQATDGVMSRLQQAWRGPDVQKHVGWWQQQHRPALLKAQQAIAGLAQSARNNASDQDQASGNAGTAPSSSAGLMPGVAPNRLGSILRTSDTVVSPLGTLAGTWGDAKKLGGLTFAGTALAGFGYFTKGYTIGEEFASGRGVDGAIDTGLVGGDLVAHSLKASHTPQGYLAGAAVQSWVDFGRDAKAFDWSSKGLQDLRGHSAGEWADSFGDALTKMPSRFVSVFGL